MDRKRIYVTGLSMGGFGTWDIIQRQPKVFAAAMPVCGGGDPAFAKKLKKCHSGRFTAIAIRL
ncbi:MAG: prolyl oligopeptidase family serine peptidase [Opitutales bacterium]|nr:prolyl oligopeptidase family serine peptidase [Opitutales bacterium]